MALTAILMSVPVWAGVVTVTSPGTTSASPVHVVASATSGNPVTAMRVYVDNTSYYTVSANKIDTYLSLPSGNRYVVIQAWDSTGAVFSSSRYVNVSGTASTTSGVNISSPGSSTSSPIHFVASASGTNPITAMRVYLDNNSVYTVNGSSLDTYINASAGTHNAVVVAWDSTGKSYSSSRTISVSGGTNTASGVTITSPGTTSSSPIHFTASARASNPITAMRVYLDNNSVYTSNGASLDTYVNASAGTHYAVVQAWDSTGAVYKSAVNVTVPSTSTSTPSTNPPNSTGANLSGKQYYVSPNGSDSNNGSSSAPWRSLAKAGSSVGAGSVVHVAPGNYGSGSEIKITASGTSSARVVFISDQKWGAKIASSVSGNSTAIWITGNYVDFVGFDITAPGVMGIYITGSNDRIVGNHVHNMATSGCQAGGGILNGNFSGASNVDIIGNVVHDIGNYTKPCSTLHGIYTANPGGRIWNNIVYRNQGWGIHTWHAASQNNISNNTVVNNGYGGILVGAGDGSWVNSGSVITNNIVYQNGLMPGANGYGIEEYGNTGRNTYQNNLVSGNGPSDWRLQNGNTSSGTIGGNPLFASYQQNGTNNNYQLQGSSPAINKGTALDAPAYDANGANRNQGSVDLGSYEYNAGGGTWPYQW